MDPLRPQEDDDGREAGAERDVPIGRPVSPGEYERLKHAPRRSPATENAQEDPSEA
jgi:hypothetical protein